MGIPCQHKHLRNKCVNVNCEAPGEYVCRVCGRLACEAHCRNKQVESAARIKIAWCGCTPIMAGAR